MRCASAYDRAVAKHQHREHRGDQLVLAARRVLTAAGEKWTALRADVFEVLAGQDRPLSAYDIADSLSARSGRRIAPNSIYRILDLFVRANLANRIESANAYLANSHPGCHHDCIFLICDQCGHAVHLDDDRLTDALRDAGRAAGFGEVRPVIELRGRCESCSGA